MGDEMMKNYARPNTWYRPKKPIYNKGILVIESDDSAVGDFTHWLPWFIKIGQKYCNFYPYGNRTVVGCSAVNTSTVGHTGRMSVAQLKTLYRRGWELLSHGDVHIGIGGHTLKTEAEAGDTQITVSAAGQAERDLGFNDREYTITDIDGITQETIKVISAVRGVSSGSDGDFILENPLQNNYSIGSVVQITEAEADLILGVTKTQITGWVGNCKHHVYAYHHRNEQSDVWVQKYYKSARGNPQTWIDVNGEINLYSLPSQLISPTTNTDVVLNLLDEVSLNDGILIVYGHGETSNEMYNFFKIIIKYAFDKGIKILTHDQALREKNLITSSE